MYRLENPVQRYAWGSPTAIPELLGHEPDGRPVAELWLGAHPSAPSTARAVGDGAGAGRLPLPDLFGRRPQETLGHRVLETFGPQLPYLLKVLAADRPLSMQVHPDAEQARAGFAREEAAGLSLSAPERTFRDPEHKPEVALALTRFEALCGFRPPAESIALLEGLDGALAADLAAVLRDSPDGTGVRAAFELLLGPEPCPPDAIAELVAACRAAAEPAREADRAVPGAVDGVLAYRTVVELAGWFPGDPGAVASLLLNRLSLAPGDALYVPAGTVHAYLRGCVVEVMANSDNVVRAALTAKHIDLEALTACTRWDPAPPARLVPVAHDAATSVLRSPATEFALADTTLTGDDRSEVLGDGPRIVLCLDGEVEIRAATQVVRLRRGESVLVSHRLTAAELVGRGRVVTAFVP